MMTSVQIRPLSDGESLPWELLFSADPARHYVEDYTRRGTCHVGELAGNIVGVYVLLPTRPGTIELVNVAVIESLQGGGVGKRLVRHAVEMARKQNYVVLEVGTGNCGMAQLALYQKCGFRIVGVDRDFYTLRYPDAIFENGIQCRDMVRMALEL